jgi:hypothetical protein
MCIHKAMVISVKSLAFSAKRRSGGLGIYGGLKTILEIATTTTNKGVINVQSETKTDASRMGQYRGWL